MHSMEKKIFNKTEFGFITDIVITEGYRCVSRSYSVWSGIIQRCYNELCPSYKNYGSKGVKVCDDWKLYSNFKKWYDQHYIEGFYLDKDILCEKLKVYPKIYSPETCMFVSRSENQKEMASRRDNSSFIYMSRNNNCMHGETKYKISGQNNYNSKPKSYYKDNPVVKSVFKTTCKKQGWNFEDFDEVWSGDRTKCYHKKYFYIEK